MMPSEALQAAVMKDILLEYEQSRFSCITTTSAKHDSFWLYLFQFVVNVRPNGSVSFPQCITLEKDTMIEQIYQALTAIKASGVKILIVHSAAFSSRTILEIAQKLSLRSLGEDLVWIFTDQAMDNDAYFFPKGSIGIAKVYNGSQELSPVMDTLYDVVLHDSVDLFSKALDLTLRKIPDRLQVDCAQGSLPVKTRKLLYSEITNNIFSGKTGHIEFSPIGDRISYRYTITKAVEVPRGTKHWHKVGTANMRMDPNDGPRSFEAFLQRDLPNPRHLKIVTIEHKPFTMLRKPSFSNRMGTSCPSSNSVICRRYLNMTASQSGTIGRTIKPSVHGDEAHELFCCYGIMIELLLLIQAKTGFTFDLYLVRDGKFGSYDAKIKHMNGMIGDVSRGVADMALATITITHERYKYVDFTTPYAGTSLTFLVKRQRHKKYPFPEWLQDTRLMKPFSVWLWLTCVGTFLVVATAVWLIEKLTKYRKMKSDYFLPFEYMAYVFGNMFHVPLTRIQAKTYAVPVLMVVANFGALVLFSSYTANLLVSLIVVDDVTVVTGLEDKKLLDPPEDFTFATIHDTSSEDFFRKSENPMLRRIYKNMKHNVVRNFSEGVAKVRSGELTAFVAESEALLYDIAEDPDCSLKLDGEQLELAGLAFALSKNSAWGREISNAIHKLNTRDKIDKIFRGWIIMGCRQGGNPVLAYKMGLDEFGGFLFNTALCCIGCFFIMSLEILFYRRITKTRQQFNVKADTRSIATITTSISAETIRCHNGNTLDNVIAS